MLNEIRNNEVSKLRIEEAHTTHFGNAVLMSRVRK